MSTLPDFLKRDLKLPAWAEEIKSVLADKGRVSAVLSLDPDQYMPEWLALVGAPTKLDQYWVEVAHQCAKMDLQKSLEGTEYQPSVAGKPVEFRVKNCPKWALKEYPAGAGVSAASTGKRVVKAGEEPNALGSSLMTARGHYIKVRGALPVL